MLLKKLKTQLVNLSKSFSYTKLGDYMRFRIISDEVYELFINDSLIDEDIYDSKDRLVEFIKERITTWKSKLKLYGFCKIKAYFKRKVGLFLEIIKFDDTVNSSTLDLRIIIMQNEKIYFETENYEMIRYYNDKRYKDGLFYCVVDDSFDEILEKVEFGSFIYGKEVINLLNNSKILC